MRKLAFCLSAALLLAGCENRQDSDTYTRGELGVSRAVEFGTILAMRDVEIAAGEGTVTAGTLLGAGAGGGGGSYIGSGSGSDWGTAGGAVAGAVIGNLIANELGKSEGIEYTLQLRDGNVKTIVQEKSEGDPMLKVGDKVLLQYCDGGNEHAKRCAPGKDFQRLLPVEQFPEEPTKKKSKRSS